MYKGKGVGGANLGCAVAIDGNNALLGAPQVDPRTDGDIDIDMSLTAPGCPVAGEMPGWVAEAVEPLPGVRTVNVTLVWEPPWGMEMLSDEAKLELGFI